jgi:hypothetical protein
VAKTEIFSAPNTIQTAFDYVFELQNLKIWNGTNGESFVPQNEEQVLYWPILKCLSGIWRTRQKFRKQAWTLGKLTGV